MSSLSYSRGPDAPLLEKTIPEVLSEMAARLPDQTALVVPHRKARLTYRQLQQRVEEVVRGFAGLGLKASDRIGVWASGCVEWVLLFLACARTGIVQVNINSAYRSLDLGFVLRKSKTKALFLHSHDGRADYEQIFGEAIKGQDLPLQHAVNEFAHAASRAVAEQPSILEESPGTRCWRRVLTSPLPRARRTISLIFNTRRELLDNCNKGEASNRPRIDCAPGKSSLKQSVRLSHDSYHPTGNYATGGESTQTVRREFEKWYAFGSTRPHSKSHPVALATARFGMFLGLVTGFAQSPTPRDTPGPRAAAAANSRPAESADSSSSGPLDATIDGNPYANRFFRFSLPIPNGWKIVPNLSASRDQSPKGGVIRRRPSRLVSS